MNDPVAVATIVDDRGRADGSADHPPLVLSNSLGSDITMWDPQVTALSTNLRVVRYDLRGHGESPVPPGPYTVADLGRDLIALLDRLAIERADLCGLSLGGMVSMWVAAHAPERVHRLVLCCTSARLEPVEAWTARAALVRAEGTASVADAVVGRWFTRGFAGAHPDVVARHRAMIAAQPPEGYAACCEAIAMMDLRPDLARISAPTLVIAAADDPAITPDHGATITAAIPRAELALVRDAAHLANVEQPAIVTALIERHLGMPDDEGTR